MPIVDVSQIKHVPMAFFTATNDEVCPHKVANKPPRMAIALQKKLKSKRFLPKCSSKMRK